MFRLTLTGQNELIEPKGTNQAGISMCIDFTRPNRFLLSFHDFIRSTELVVNIETCSSCLSSIFHKYHQLGVLDQPVFFGSLLPINKYLVLALSCCNLRLISLCLRRILKFLTTNISRVWFYHDFHGI